MLGSLASVADPNIVLNTVAAEMFSQAADALEGAKDFDKACTEYTKKLLTEHYKVVFNYDGYGPEWEPEAERRGLLNNKTTADAIPECFKNENVALFVRQGVYTEKEAIARANIQLENYNKTINIEALTMIEMAKREIYPAVNGYATELCDAICAKRAVSEKMIVSADVALAEKLSLLIDGLSASVEKLEKDLLEMPEELLPASKKMAHVIVPDMDAVRTIVDELERICSSEYWPYPTYYDIMYSVK